MLERGIGIEFDQAAYEPQKIMGVRHKLMNHPLLQLPEIIELARRLNKKGSIRYHNASAKPGTDFIMAPETHKPKYSVEDTLKHIEEAEVWFALHNIQLDPVYEKFVADVLDDIKPRIEPKDPGMHDYAGWIFLTSPNAVTPYHMDHENNFILQLHGTKEIHVWDPLDRDVVTEASLELFHGRLSRDLVKYEERYQNRAHVFKAEPGMGVYMPQTAPHWVKNGNDLSITISFTYYTRATMERRLLYFGNHRLRSLGLSPKPIGASRVRDTAKFLAFRGWQEARALVRGNKYPNPTYVPPGFANGPQADAMGGMSGPS